MDHVLERHSSELMILVLSAMVFGTLVVLVPQLLRAHHHAQVNLHTEYMRAVEAGQPLPRRDDRSRAAGRATALVPMVVVCTAGTVTCFLAAYKTESLFSVALAVWSVAGVVSLAAITGGVALMGRLAQLELGRDDEEEPLPQPVPPEK
ncbi:MAG: hypothetical protein K2R98_05800 [Gemmataceae bacterium]|nr:hypothetical protein [Gemmataceae bacterium]